jgi:hypothetical protein
MGGLLGLDAYKKTMPIILTYANSRTCLFYTLAITKLSIINDFVHHFILDKTTHHF